MTPKATISPGRKLRSSSSVKPTGKNVANTSSRNMDESETEYEEDDLPNSTKRKRGGAGSKKDDIRSGKKSKKQAGDGSPLYEPLAEIPYDMLTEIFSWFSPPELLNLGRTCRSLKSLLIGPDMKLMWKNALSRAGLPECPPQISHPAFAELAYGIGCLSCGKTTGNIYHLWEDYMRLCTQCVSIHGYHDRRPKLSDSLLNQLIKYLPFVLLRNVKHYSVAHQAKWNTEYSATTRSNGRTWLKEKVKELEKIKETSQQCQRWIDARLEAELLQQQQEVRERKQMVVEMIKELGWEYELSLTPADSLPQDRSEITKICARNFTDRVIANLKARLPVIMEELKGQRQKREFDEARKARIALLDSTYDQALKTYWPFDAYRSQTADILLIRRIRDIIDVPGNQKDVKFPFADSLDSLTEVINEASDIINRKISAMVPVPTKSASEGLTLTPTPDPSSLATTLLSGRRPFCTVNQALKCPAARTYTPYGLRDADGSSNFYATAYDVLGSGPWNVNGEIKLERKAHNTAISILRMVFKLNPLTTTTEMMDTMDPIVECLDCNDMEAGRMMMSWTALIDHHMSTYTHSTDNTPNTWARYCIITDEKLLNEVRHCMAKTILQNHYTYKTKYVCSHCGRIDAIKNIRGHLSYKHKLDNPGYDDMKPLLYDNKKPSRCILESSHDTYRGKLDQGSTEWVWPPRVPRHYVETLDAEYI